MSGDRWSTCSAIVCYISVKRFGVRKSYVRAWIQGHDFGDSKKIWSTRHTFSPRNRHRSDLLDLLCILYQLRRAIQVPEVTPSVQTLFPGWNEAVRKVGAKASIKDIREIKDWFKEHRHIHLRNPVHEIAWTGRVKVMEFILLTSYNFNSYGNCGKTVFHAACLSRSLEMVQLIIRSWTRLL